MAQSAKVGLPVIGIILLLLAVFKFVSGDPWVVWAILGFLFGGFGVFSRKLSGGDQS